MERKIYTKEEIEEKLNSLPEEIRRLIYSDEIDSAVQKIGQKNKLHIDQLGLLQAEITDVLIGTTATEEFVPYLVETLEIDEEKAQAIAQDANTLIFVKIRASMKQATVGTPSTQETPQIPLPPQKSTIPEHLPAPKSEFRAADIVLTQKTTTAPTLITPVPTYHAPVTIQPLASEDAHSAPPVPKAPASPVKNIPLVTLPSTPVPPTPVETLPTIHVATPDISTVTSTSPLPNTPAAVAQNSALLQTPSVSTPNVTPPTPKSISSVVEQTPLKGQVSPTPPRPYTTDPYHEPIE